MVFHLLVHNARDAQEDGWGMTPDELAELLEHTVGYWWDTAYEVLL
ncbi:hypothetical protein [Micromonospora luteifusca]